MIRYSVIVWPEEQIAEESEFWAKNASDKDCICQDSNVHVNSKLLYFFYCFVLEEEFAYAACWIQGVQELIMARPNSVGKEEQRNPRWDP